MFEAHSKECLGGFKWGVSGEMSGIQGRRGTHNEKMNTESKGSWGACCKEQPASCKVYNIGRTATGRKFASRAYQDILDCEQGGKIGGGGGEGCGGCGGGP